MARDIPELRDKDRCLPDGIWRAIGTALFTTMGGKWVRLV